MISTYILLSAALAALARAQSIPGLPSCASSCVSDFGDCGPIDVECICNSDTIISDLACCVSTACDEADQEATIDFANNLCGADRDQPLPQTATCASSSSTGSSTSTSTGTSTSTETTGTSASAEPSPTEEDSEASATPTGDSDEEDSDSGDNGAMSNSPASAFGFGVMFAGLLALF